MINIRRYCRTFTLLPEKVLTALSQLFQYPPKKNKKRNFATISADQAAQQLLSTMPAVWVVLCVCVCVCVCVCLCVCGALAGIH